MSRKSSRSAVERVLMRALKIAQSEECREVSVFMVDAKGMGYSISIDDLAATRQREMLDEMAEMPIKEMARG